MIMKVQKEALQRAITLVGSQRKLGLCCGVIQQCVAAWLKNGVPSRHVLSIEQATRGAVTRYELRPDLYPQEKR